MSRKSVGSVPKATTPRPKIDYPDVNDRIDLNDYISKAKVREVIFKDTAISPMTEKRLYEKLGLNNKLFGMEIKEDKSLKKEEFRLE